MTTEPLDEPAMRDARSRGCARALDARRRAPTTRPRTRTTARERPAAPRRSSRRATRPASPSSRAAGGSSATSSPRRSRCTPPSGGIVPEVAARAHLRWIVPVLDEAWAGAGVGLGRHRRRRRHLRPGAGRLAPRRASTSPRRWPGSTTSRSSAVNHLEGHVYAGWLLDPGEDEASRPEPIFPLVALVVSGGHTFLAEMRDHLTYRLLGTTVDDAAGEAFDKVGRLLGLGYPGGPAIQTAAEGAIRRDVRFPRAWMGDTYDWSFSGLKTAARRIVADARAAEGLPADDPEAPPVRRRRSPSSPGASRTRSSTSSRPRPPGRRREIGARSIVLGGGVAANSVPARAAARRGGRARRAAHRAATRAVHRQRGDDRGRRRAPVRGRGAGRARPRRPAVAAAGHADEARPPAPAIDPAEVRATLRAAGLRARHALSQNFLADADVLDAILAEAAPAPGDRSSRSGPGSGC